MKKIEKEDTKINEVNANKKMTIKKGNLSKKKKLRQCMFYPDEQ